MGTSRNLLSQWDRVPNHYSRRCTLIIAGGYYRELCERPHWNAFFGSGGRAAAALVEIVPAVELYTYCHREQLGDLHEICNIGVSLHTFPSNYEIVFAYLHPLKPPGIAPAISDIRPENPITCRGEVVLRFGFLEGDAIVHGDRVIFDPQSNSAPSPFDANGSSANSLALVLNEDELRVSMPGYTLPDAAKALLAFNHADVAVIKCGPKGAVVMERGQALSKVPAFRTPRVFKIGSGDVFSAAFAHYWGTEERSAREAAELASRCTATYCSSHHLPLPAEDALPDFPPVFADERKQVCIFCATDTLANHWLVEESRCCIEQLGIHAHVYDATTDGLGHLPHHLTSALVLADTLEDRGERSIRSARERNLPVVVLKEHGSTTGITNSQVQMTNDFTTALYWAIWAPI